MKELLKKLAEIDASLDALLSGDDLTDSQQAEHDRLVAERNKIKSQIEAKKAKAERDAERKELEAQEAAQAERERRQALAGPGRRTTPDEPGTPSAANTPTVPAQVNTPDPTGGFRSPREFLQCVMAYGQGRTLDPRLAPRLTVGSDEQRGNHDPSGGFLLPESFSPNLLQLTPEGDPVGSLVTTVPMATPTIRMAARVDKNHATSVSGGLTVTRRPETVAGTASQMSFEQITMQAHNLFGLSYATEEILYDSPISFVAILERGFQDQFMFHLLSERINGTGIGEYLGVLNAPCLLSVAKESGQAATTIVKENIDKMVARCWRYSEAVWLANHNTRPQLKNLSQVVGVGGAPVPYFETTPGGGAMLDGRPLFFTEQCKTLGTKGDLILGVWGEYLEGTYQSMEMAESIHVRFVNHERAFKFWLRNDGRPWWNTVLTPTNGDTLSPFVVLDTRA